MYHWLKQLWDPRYTVRGLIALPRFFLQALRYRRSLTVGEPARFRLRPQLHDRQSTSPVEQHYFFLNGWALRKIAASRPSLHVDIGSQVGFVNSAAAVVPTIFVDLRPLEVTMPGLVPVAGDILTLPFGDNSVGSVSCLHVAEHIGLGRYGDALDPLGTKKAAQELVRVLAPTGDLYLGLPIGTPRTYFNAHRVHSIEQILNYFGGLVLHQFSAVTDEGTYLEDAEQSAFGTSRYACGMFHFRKSTP